MTNQSSRDYPPYPETTTPGTRSSEGSGTSVTEKASQAAGKAKDKAAELGRSAAAKIDEQREPAAGALEGAAATLHDKAESLPGGESVSSVAHTAADKLQATADYVREHDVRDVMSDVEELVKSHPTQSLLAAAAVGFLIGRAFRTD
jgi:ElaB/YqjD/DUF883 family membrane-anchored ribosome-binding protein